MAAILLGNHDGKSTAVSAGQARNDQILHSMAKFKELCLATEVSIEDRPPAYRETVSQSSIAYSSIEYDHEAANPDKRKGRIRVNGTFTHNGAKTSVFIEWKSYQVRWLDVNDDDRDSVPLEANVVRVQELTGLLKHSKQAGFLIPQYLGYFDNRDDKSNSENPERFGIVFERPNQTDGTQGPVSLREALTDSCPSLSVRVILAHKLANSLLYLHGVKWLHKGLQSDGILFSRNPKSGKINFSEPLLSGFEYARPDREGVQSTSLLQDPLAELYVHPDYHGDNARGSFQKTFDIYSLGIILLEIAHWQPIQEITKIADPDHPKPYELREVRVTILSESSRILEKVRASVGDQFHEAVASCIKGLEAFGLAANEDDTKSVSGAILQREFTKVVENLAEICV